MSDNLISISFEFHGVTQDHEIIVKDPPTFDPNSVADDASQSNKYGYSGRHDHGTLPPLKSGDQHAKILSSMVEAKRLCDEYLTQCMSNSEHICMQATSAQNGAVTIFDSDNADTLLPVDKKARVENDQSVDEVAT